MRKQSKAIKREQNRKRQAEYRRRKIAAGWREKKVWVKGQKQEEMLALLTQADCTILELMSCNFDSFADWTMQILGGED